MVLCKKTAPSDFISASNTTTTTSTMSLDLEKKINEVTADLQPWYADKLFSISPK
jgi:hypothetical protein